MSIRTNFIISKNLYHVVKKRSLNQNELSSYLLNHPEYNRLIGALPYDWLKTVQKQDIKSLSEKVADIFSEFGESVSDIRTREYFLAVKGAKLRLKKFQKNLEQKLKEILQRQDVSVNYAGSGAFKHCHKITVGNYEYALSTFINNKSSSEEEARRNYFNDSFQGKGYEPQNVFTLYKNGEHGRWAKPFFSKVAGICDKDGFILSKFINESRPEKPFQGTFERKHLRVKNNDFALRNTIKGVYIDTGGSILNDNYIRDNKTRNIWLSLARNFDNINKIIENYKYRCLDNSIAKDIDNGIDIFEKYSDLDLYALTPSQKRAMSNILKNLKSAVKLKRIAEERGLWDSVKNILNKDLQEEYPYSKEIWGEQDKYYSKSFAKLLGVSNKLPAKDLIQRCDYLPFWSIKKDYSQSEIIEGMIQSWQYISKKRKVLEKLRKEFSIDTNQYEYIKKEGRANINRKEI